jgi:hypothetical protein
MDGSLRPILSRFSDYARPLKEFPLPYSTFLGGRLGRDLPIDYLRREFGGAGRAFPWDALRTMWRAAG